MNTTFPSKELEVLRNRTFDEIAVGDHASIQRTLTAADIQLFAAMSGDMNPQHLDPEFAASTPSHGVIAHGMWGAALISAVLGTRLPGPGTVYLGQTLKFRSTIRVGDTLTITVTVIARDETKHSVVLACTCVNQDGQTVISGEATVTAPTQRFERPRGSLPQVRISVTEGDDLVRLLEHVRPLGRIRMAVVHPCDETSLSAALDARAAGLIEPVLIAPRERLAGAGAHVPASTSRASRSRTCRTARRPPRAASSWRAAGKVDALMKGSLHTDELMGAVVASPACAPAVASSHCFLMQTPAYPRPLHHHRRRRQHRADAEGQGATSCATRSTWRTPSASRGRASAMLAAVETVNSDMPATLDAAALCKMADRGQITGAVARRPARLRQRGVRGRRAHQGHRIRGRAGRPTSWWCRTSKSGNMLAKQLEYLGGASSAGIVMGARVPIVLTSRADSREARIASCAVALVVARRGAQRPAPAAAAPAGRQPELPP